MEWTKNCRALGKQWVKPSYFTISPKPRAWNTPRLNYFEYTNRPLSPHCVHNLSLPWIQTAASLLNSSVPRSLIAPSGYVWICSTPHNEAPETSAPQGKFGPYVNAYPYVDKVWHKGACTLGPWVPFTVTIHNNTQYLPRRAIRLILAGTGLAGGLASPWSENLTISLESLALTTGSVLNRISTSLDSLANVVMGNR